jgi:putative transposase
MVASVAISAFTWSVITLSVVASAFRRTEWNPICSYLEVLPRRPEHLKSFDYIGLHRYFLTFCTFERLPHFTIARHVELVLQQILRATAEEAFVVLAYCFMPDHLHLLIEGQADDCDARRFTKLAKQYSGFYFKKSIGQRLWQRYGFEHTLRNDEDTLGVARYIVENPVRARLVKRVEDYAFAGSAIYTLREILDSVVITPRWSG